MAIANKYPVTVQLLPNLPRIPYRLGVGRREGVVVHYTDTKKDTAASEHKYEAGHWREAFVHEFIDATTCLVQADKDYICWGCGPHGNQRYYQIEMCDAKNQAEFNAIFDRTAYRVAQVLFEDGLKPEDNVTVRSHYQISQQWPHDTDHTDPIDYLKKWGKTWEDLVNLVTKYYNEFVGEGKNAPTDGIKSVRGNAPTTTAPQTVFKEGDSGPEVKQIQQMLGLPAHECDGVFGPITTAAVKGFQTAHHITADGIVGPVTMGLLKANQTVKAAASSTKTATEAKPATVQVTAQKASATVAQDSAKVEAPKTAEAPKAPAPATKAEPATTPDPLLSAIELAKQRGIFKTDHKVDEPVDFGLLASALNNLYEVLGGK